ncbi:MAG TPA: DUF2513 domain-containing protein [Bacteroidia bacterium]|nr:DUF2513 domain-containing protein [Bacteroidia bacterium]
MDLVRDLLLYFEAKADPSIIRPGDVELPGYDQHLVHYHIILICEAGLLTCERMESSTTPSRLIEALPFGLSWKGHEFLDAARNEGLWNQAKQLLKRQGITVGFGLLQALLMSLSKQYLQLPE